MIDIRPLPDRSVQITGLTALPTILRTFAADAPTDRATLDRFASVAEDRTEDPLAQLEAEQVHDEIAAAVRTAEQSQDTVAAAALDRWDRAVPGHPEVFRDVLSTEDALVLSAWCNRIYQQLRTAELDAAGTTVTVGSSCGVEDLLAELVGPDPTSAGEVEMSEPTLVFASLAMMLLDAATA